MTGPSGMRRVHKRLILMFAKEREKELKNMKEVRWMPRKRIKQFPERLRIGNYWFSSQAMTASLYSITLKKYRCNYNWIQAISLSDSCWRLKGKKRIGWLIQFRRSFPIRGCRSTWSRPSTCKGLVKTSSSDREVSRVPQSKSREKNEKQIAHSSSIHMRWQTAPLFTPTWIMSSRVLCK